MKYSNTKRLFISLFITHLLLNLTNSVCQIASSYMAGNFLDVVASSCYSLITPFTVLITSIASIYSSSSSIVCGRFMGVGDKKSMNKTFTNAIRISTITAILLTIIVMIFPKEIITILGGTPEIMNQAITYLRAYGIGMFAYIFIPVFTSFLHIENEGKYITSSLVVLAIVYVASGYLFVKILDLTYFGFGLANSFSQIVVFVYLLARLIKNREQLFIDRSDTDKEIIKKLLILGLPSGISGALYSFRDVVMNNVLMETAGVVGMATKTIVLGRISIVGAVITSCLTTTSLLGSIFIGEKNKDELVEMFNFIFFDITPIFIAYVLLNITFIPMLGGFYSNDPAVLSMAETTCALRFIPTILELICDVLIANYTIFEYNKFVNAFNVLHSFAFHAGFALAFKSILGPYAAFGGYLFTEVMCSIVLFIYASIKNKSRIASTEDILLLKGNFDTNTKFNKTLESYEQIGNLSKEISDFCIEHNIDRKRSNLTGLCIEELCKDTFEESTLKKNTKGVRIDVYVIIEGSEITIRIRDNFELSNATSRIDIFNPEDPCKNVGVRLVSKISKQMIYQNVFGLNNMIVKM